MVLAELVASGELVSADELRPGDGIALLPLRLDGVTLCPGLAAASPCCMSRRMQLQQLVAEDPEREVERLRCRRSMEMQSSIDTMLAPATSPASGEHLEVLETYRLFAAGPRLAQPHRWRRCTPASPPKRRCRRCRTTPAPACARSTDPYLRERLADLDDLANRLLRHLLGADMPTLRRLPDEAILVARTMGPAELLDYDRARLKGAGAGGRLAERPCRDRRARARHSGARPLPGPDAAGRATAIRW